jgi:hypothetical protein
MKSELRGVRPKRDEFLQVLYREARRSIKVEDPSIVGNGIPHIPALLLGHGKDGGGYAFGAEAIRPRIAPKTRFIPVPNVDLGERVEKLHILLTTRVLHPNPRLLRCLPS